MTQDFIWKPPEPPEASEQHDWPFLHWASWMRYGATTGTNDADVVWANYEECWCGLIRAITVSTA